MPAAAYAPFRVNSHRHETRKHQAEQLWLDKYIIPLCCIRMSLPRGRVDDHGETHSPRSHTCTAQGCVHFLTNCSIPQSDTVFPWLCPACQHAAFPVDPDQLPPAQRLWGQGHGMTETSEIPADRRGNSLLH